MINKPRDHHKFQNFEEKKSEQNKRKKKAAAENETTPNGGGFAPPWIGHKTAANESLDIATSTRGIKEESGESQSQKKSNRKENQYNKRETEWK